jgi:hypothetical protein
MNYNPIVISFFKHFNLELQLLTFHNTSRQDFVRSYPMPIDVLTLSCASHTLRVKNDGEEKYPVSSFVLNCKGETNYF